MITKEDWAEGFSILLEDHKTNPGLWKKRTLSQMKSWFSDQAAAEAILGVEDPVIYEYQEIGAPEYPGDVAFGISRVFPGKVGREFYMTKGHFHNISDTAEVYYGLKGNGLLLIENEDGVWKTLPLEPGVASYVPKGFAHRSINTGSGPLEFFFAFRADAGHNYGRIEISGFSHIVTESDLLHEN
jgi:glucose-6-phosphate isomerase